MNVRRLLSLLLCIGIVISTCGMAGAPPQLPVLQIKIETPLLIPRTFHTTTQLKDGTILIVGGSSAQDVHLDSVHIFNPVTRTYTPTGSLHTARHGHTATLLRDGRVLVVGGYSLPQQWLDDAEIYDPLTGQWTQTYLPHMHGTAHTATLMKDGRVLVVGGCIGDHICTNQVDIFNPQSDSWVEAPALASDRASHTANLLKNGRVLVAGGMGVSGTTPADGYALLYDPILNKWNTTGPMVAPRHQAQSTTLSDGRILVAGGFLIGDPSNKSILNLAEIYDPVSNKWSITGSMSKARFAFVMKRLPSGHVLAVGGSRDGDNSWTDASIIHEVESYDVRTGIWTTLGTLPQVGAYGNGVVLSDGRLWVTGGQVVQTCLSETWLLRLKNTAELPVVPPNSFKIDILLDDFNQPYQEGHNGTEGEYGTLNGSMPDWQPGRLTTTIAPGKTWDGVWMSLNHPLDDALPVNFSRILPVQIQPMYQSRIAALKMTVTGATPGRKLKLELKNGTKLKWTQKITLTGGEQRLQFTLPPIGSVNHLVWVLDNAQPGDYVTVEHVSFTAISQPMDTPTAAFVWSYGMLLNNWDPAAGLVRDKSRLHTGEFDALQATGSLAAATAIAAQLGVVTRADAIKIVNRISKTIQNDIPRHNGLLPHFVEEIHEGEFGIAKNTEWSSVDTVITLIGLLDAQTGLGLDTSETEQLLMEIDWEPLITPDGISHGYSNDHTPLSSSWNVFGGESWLVQLAYASTTGNIAPQAYTSPPTANGSGFIDELAWLFVPPPAGLDHWGTDWAVYRQIATQRQLTYYPNHVPNCFASLGLFGLSAAEVPDPFNDDPDYEDFGVGGAFAEPNDSTENGSYIVVPHHSALIASLRPDDARRMWSWLISNGYFSPLNNIESFNFLSDSDCDPQNVERNHLKGSWNLALQTLGWGRYLAERNHKSPILWRAARTNPFLKQGYDLLANPSILTPALNGLEAVPAEFSWSITRDLQIYSE